jgi:homoserine dehydrogenase
MATNNHKSNRNTVKLGVFGFGCVGQGLHQVLNATRGINADIKKICIKDGRKKRSLPTALFTTDGDEILNDPEIDIVVELIDDSEAAYEIVKSALQKRKAVVSANKKMIAEKLPELYKLQQKYNTPLLYEASCCASIPIIRNLEEYYDNDLLNSVEGIFNGSTNYILSSVFNEGLTFEKALTQAQELGFTESDPVLDLEGFDPVYKTSIVILHTFGLFIPPEEIFHYGIQNLNAFDIEVARKRGATIKLISKCAKKDGKVYAYCLPKFVNGNSPLSKVDEEYNGIVLESCFAENQFFVGKGAGAQPTGSAVISDISALTYQYKYEYKKISQKNGYEPGNNINLKVYMRYRPYASIDLTRFRTITEKYSSSDGSYVIGTINLKDLWYYKQIDEADLNMVLLEEV